MNHLPYPANPSLPRVVVPDLCAEVEQYDRCGFATYPIRQGWMAFAHESPWTDCDARVAASRAQTWLYFGLLQEFFGDEYHRPMFVCNDKITTENLSDMLQKWATKKTSKKKASNAETYVLLLLAERHSQHLDALVASARAIALSIKVLIDSLGIAAGIIDSGIRRNEAFNASPSRLLEERMVDLNWCPYWVQTYVASYSVATINYIAALTRTTMVEDHGACTTNRCVAHNVDMQHYQTKHVKDGCQCSFLGPSISKIQASINEGNVPLIRCTEAPGGRILVDVIEAEPGVEYTAISHVWSGGLGNPHSNSLPECQLRRLTQRMQDIALVESEWFWFRLIERGFKYVNIPSKAQIKSSLLSCGIKTTPRSKAIFWLDTLCVPTTLEHSALRRKAIDQMAFIYAGADRILVLDPELQDLEMENMSNEQICAYLTCCAWRTRCWPYQEGRLARDRMYLLKYGIYHHSASLRRIEKANLDIKRGRRLRNDTDVLHSAVASFWEDMNDVKNASKDLHAGEFLKTWNSLSLRSTTKSEDLHGILAVLLGLSSREILSLRLQERTKAIFQTQESLPLALLFLKDPGLRTHDIKNKWIPQYPSARLTSQYGDMAQSVPLGSFTFSAAESLSIGYLVDAAIPFHQHFCLIDDMTSEKVWTQVTGEYDEELEALYRHRPVCYILSNHLAVTHSASSSTHFVGARFYVSKYDDDGTLHLVYDSALNYYYQHPFNAAEDLLEFFDYTEVQGLRTSPEARFVLDCDLASWYKPRYRRPKVSRLQVWRNIYTAPAITFVMIVWCPCILIWSLGVFGKGVGLYSTAVPALVAAFIRANVGRYFELPLLVEAYKRLEYKQWSASLDAPRVAENARFSYRPDNGPLYQYRPQWIAGVVILAGCILLYAGFSLHFYSATILGAILIIETVPRITVEILWRRTRLGDFGRRFAQRWLHRVYWEADSHS